MPHERITIDADTTKEFTACYFRIANGECAFIEAHTKHAVPKLMAALSAHRMHPEDVRWIVVTHAHLDHAAGASALLSLCPRAEILAHPRTAKHLVSPAKLIDGALAVYGEGRFRALYGDIEPAPASRVRSLGDGESFALGGALLTAWHTYGHAFHHLVVDDPEMDTVYTGDTFGLVYPALQLAGRFALPSTSPTGFNALEAKKSLDKVLSLQRRFVAPTHFGAYDDAEQIAAQVKRFIERAEGWVAAGASGGESAEALERRFTAAFWQAIEQEAPHFGPKERQLLSLDVELNAAGLSYAAIERRGAQVRT